MRFRPLPIVAALVAIALAVAGCGSSSDDSSGSSTSTAGSAASSGATTMPSKPAGAAATAGAATVKAARTPLGTILVDAGGRTLYLWVADTGTSSTCSGDCAQAWPPLTTKGRPAAAAGAQGAMLGTTKRDDGTMQVTYAGHPLYHFAGDAAAGDTAGQGSDGFGAKWWAVAPDGRADEQTGDSGAQAGGASGY